MEKSGYVQLSKKAWHYRLQKFVFRSNMPNLFNLCPYFWLTIFSLLAFLPLLPFRFLEWIMNFVADRLIIPNVERWVENINEEDFTLLYDFGSSCIRKPWGFSLVDRHYLLSLWFKKHKIDLKTKKGAEKFNKLLQKYRKIITEREYKRSLEESARYSRKIERRERITNGIDNFFDVIIANAFSKFFSKFDFTHIIKWTKRFVGLVITSVLLVALYFVLSWTGRSILWLVVNWNWHVFLIVLSVIAATVLLILLIGATGVWIEWMKEKYQVGRKIWYVEVLKYIVFFPLVYVVYYPVVGIFYLFIWKIIIVRFIWGSLKLFWKGFVGFLGIFGEYFGASYTDYCPGIEWKEDNDN